MFEGWFEEMAKILISTLGTGTKENGGKYKTALYKFHENDKGYETSFFASALCEFLNVDKLFLIGTKKSLWDEVYFFFQTKSNHKHDDHYYYYLGEQLEPKNDTSSLTQTDLEKIDEAIDCYLKKVNPHSSGGSKCKLIPYGFNKEELQEILQVFMEIGESIKTGDEIYLDITHSFRSIPFVMYMMFDFIQNLRLKEHITLAGIYYGMLEVHKEKNYAPIVDLEPLFQISRWSKSAYNFITNGNGYLMAELIEDQKLSQIIKNISDSLSLNHIKDLKSEMDKLNHYLRNHPYSNIYFQYLEPHVKKFIERFKGITNDAEFQYKLAEWYFENQHYTNGYICLAESIVSWITYLYSKEYPELKIKVGNKKDRDRTKTFFTYVEDLKPQEDINHQMAELYKEIKDIRNNIAHAGFLEDNSIKYYVEKANYYCKKAKQLVFNNKQLPSLIKDSPIHTFQINR